MNAPPRMPTRARSLLTGMVLAIALCGCDDPISRAKKLPSQERMYAESLFVPAEQLGEGWQELGRCVTARTAYGWTDEVQTGKAESVPHLKLSTEKLLKPDGPCSVVSGIAYAGPEGAEEAALAVTYLCRRYHALPLKTGDALPQVDVAAWERGEDGIALGTGRAAEVKALAAEAPAEIEAEAAAAPNAAAEEAADGAEDASADEVPADDEARDPAKDEAPEADTETEAAEAALQGAEDAEGPDEEAGATEVASDEAGETAAATAEADEAAEDAPDAVAAADATEAGEETDAPEAAAGTAEPGTAEAADDATPDEAPGPRGHLTYLAANGLLVKIWSADAPEKEHVQQAVSAVRKRLAASAALEQRHLEAVMKRHGDREEKLHVRKRWDPNAAVYWRMLDFAIAGTILETEY